MPEPVRTLRKRIHPARIAAGVIGILALAGMLWVVWGAIQEDRQNTEMETEDETTAVLCVADECARIRADGTVLDATLRPHGSLLLVLEDHTRDTLPERGEQLFSEEILLQIENVRIATAEALPIRLGHVELHDRHYQDASFVTNEGWTLMAALSVDARVTVEILRRVLAELGPARERLSYIDIRIPDRVFFKMRE